MTHNPSQAPSAIQVLPPEVSNRIAAGEVVERPAAVVRELIDNAIDAGASRIDVEIDKGGLGLIRVSDDGYGMNVDDAVLCVRRHATSKIRSADDLASITTCGFRGEALAAISSVSRFELQTRRQDADMGTLIVVEGGKEYEPKPAGAPVGTTITIKDLFYNVPARRKFLKRPATEQSHIMSAITCNALAYETIHFTLTTNGRRSLDLPAASTRAERIQQLFGKDVVDELIPIHLETPAVTLSGFISRPTLSRNGAQQVYFFVNDRFVRNRILHRAMMDGYRNLLHSGRYPVVFIFIEINPADIDINVHPTKQEIKFSREDVVFSSLYGAIRQGWESGTVPKVSDPQHEKVPPTMDVPPPETIKPTVEIATPVLRENASAALSVDKPSEEKKVFQFPPAENKPADTVSHPSAISPLPSETYEQPVPISKPITMESTRQAIEKLNRKPPQSSFSQSPLQEPPLTEPVGLHKFDRAESQPEDLFTAASLEDVGELSIRGQLLNSYILVEGKEGMYGVDQHAAHERILFEEFLERFNKAPLVSQALLFPLTVDFAPDELELIEEQLENFERLGFDIEAFGPKTYVIRGIPTSLKLDDAETFIKDLLGEIRFEGSATERQEKALYTLACRAAVKFGDKLTHNEMIGIVRKMQLIPRRNVCPHGRPTVLFVSSHNLEKAFKRTGF